MYERRNHCPLNTTYNQNWGKSYADQSDHYQFYGDMVCSCSINLDIDTLQVRVQKG